RGDVNLCRDAVEALAAVAARMEPAEAARACGEAARSLTDALFKQPKHVHHRSDLGGDLAVVAARMDPADAARVCAEAARVLSETLADEANELARADLVDGLAAVAARMDPADAARVVETAIPGILSTHEDVVRLLPWADPAKVPRIACEVAMVFVSEF